MLRKQLYGQLRAPILHLVVRFAHIKVFRQRDESLDISAGMFEPNEFCWLMTLCRPGMVFVDLGANIGLYTSSPPSTWDRMGGVLAVEERPASSGALHESVGLQRPAECDVCSGRAVRS